jgi:hypothetical protein
LYNHEEIIGDPRRVRWRWTQAMPPVQHPPAHKNVAPSLMSMTLEICAFVTVEK